MPQTRESIISAAEKYIHQGLVAHQPGLVPFADSVERTELGMTTGKGAAQLRKLLEGDAYDAVLGVQNLRWIVENDQAVVFYEQLISFLPEPLLVCTRFRVNEGLIEEIEILLYAKDMTDAIARNVTQLSTD